MVIGNGLIANVFKNKYENDNEFLIFASGVSNSSCIDSNHFSREIELIEQNLKKNDNKHFVYFSTCSFYDPSIKESQYLNHKKKAESLISKLSNSFSIFRVPNLVGKTSNPHTILNYLHNCIINNIPFHVWKNSSRNFLDVDDLLNLSNSILQIDEMKNQIINIASPMNYPIIQVVENLEHFCNKKAIYTTLEKGACFDIDIRAIKPLLDICLDMNHPSYLYKLICKYYPNILI